MKKENLIQYALLGCIAFIVLIGLVYTIKTSSSLKNAVSSLNEAKHKVEESAKMLSDQKVIIDSIKISNARLLIDLGKMQNGYNQINSKISSDLIQASKTFEYLKLKIKNLSSYDLPIE